MFRIYTDGGCSGNPGPGGWAFVILHDDDAKPAAEKSGGEKATTNNRMELLAVISALEELKALRLPAQTGADAKEPAAVYTDSQYVQKGITEWLPNWKRKNWFTAGKTPVKNKDLWQRLDALCAAQGNISWQWVKGHAGNEWNERCDALVRCATAKQIGRNGTSNDASLL